MNKYIIGIDLGGRSIKFGLFTEDGDLINKSNIITRTDEDGKHILPDLVEHLHKIFTKYNLTKESLIGIGLGVPGPILNKRVVVRAVNLGWEGNVHAADYIEEHTGIRVLVENDANVAALGEMWKGAAEGYQDVVMVTLGTGVGGGIISNGKLISGSTGSGGEIGHMPFLQNPIERTCGCGGNRCLEQVASATGIEYIAQDYLFRYDIESKLKEYDGLTAKDIFECAKEKDELALKITEEYFNHLGRGLAIVGSIVDPAIFVIGGGVSHAGDFLIDNLRESYKKYAFSVIRNSQFVQATLGNDAGIYGAAKLIIN
ncbi:MAG: ROK family glucokinase [Tissierellia bacterium]|nr:ROK family glucokinase [Tissierellia bacterium]